GSTRLSDGGNVDRLDRDSSPRDDVSMLVDDARHEILAWKRAEPHLHRLAVDEAHGIRVSDEELRGRRAEDDGDGAAVVDPLEREAPVLVRARAREPRATARAKTQDARGDLAAIEKDDT